MQSIHSPTKTIYITLMESCALIKVSGHLIFILRFVSPFSSKVVVCGDRLVTLSLTVNETIKWLSQLPVLKHETFWW